MDLLVDGENPLLSAIEEIDNALGVGKQELLKEEELNQIALRSENRIKEVLVEDSLFCREFDKLKRVTRWRDVYNRGFVSPKDVEGTLTWLRDFAVKVLVEEGKTPKQKQYFIDKSQTFSGRKLLRDILQTAKKSIDIQDNYIHGSSSDLELLNILQPHVEDNQNLSIRILTDNVSNAFKSDFELFNQQYGNRLDLRIHHNTHGRFIIIDSQDVYHIGSSIKDLGKKADLVSLVSENSEKEKVLKEYEDWFQNGTKT